MSYEYMSGMGTDKTAHGAAQNTAATLVPSPGWLTPEEAAVDAAEFGRSQRLDHIEALNETIDMVRDGDQEALRALRRDMAHNDMVESLAHCARPENVTTDIRQYCQTLRLAQQVAEGNDPQVRQRMMMWAGIGAGTLVVGGVLYMLLK